VRKLLSEAAGIEQANGQWRINIVAKGYREDVVFVVVRAMEAGLQLWVDGELTGSERREFGGRYNIVRYDAGDGTDGVKWRGLHGERSDCDSAGGDGGWLVRGAEHE
jgi:hypothetical protein